MEIKKAAQLVTKEYIYASDKFPPFKSAHEGIAIIEEEFLELREEVFKNQDKQSRMLLVKESKQLAAMALRFLVDIC